MGRKEVLAVKSDVAYNTKTIGHDAEFISIAEMSIDIHLLDGMICKSMRRQRIISCLVRIVRGLQIDNLLKVCSCLIIRSAYLSLFSITHALMPEVSKMVMEAREKSSFWHIGSVRSII